MFREPVEIDLKAEPPKAMLPDPDDVYKALLPRPILPVPEALRKAW